MPMQLDEGGTRAPNQSPEIALWRAVINQALGDLSGRKDGTARGEVEKVIAWVGTVDFVRCCFNADLDPEAVESEFRKAIEEMEKSQ